MVLHNNLALTLDQGGGCVFIFDDVKRDGIYILPVLRLYRTLGRSSKACTQKLMEDVSCSVVVFVSDLRSL